MTLLRVLGHHAHALRIPAAGRRVLPLGAAGFLGRIIWKSVQDAPASQNWSLAGIMILSLGLMLTARFGLQSQFFAIPRERDTPGQAPASS